jgi:hypothetical protein
VVNTSTIKVLPLVRDHQRKWQAGWCTYPDGFDENPDIEVFCGGENDKMAGAAAVWRQGNLLHFGFEQGPADMNEAGQRLLLNCIAYISRFTEDRPIAITPSVFAGPVALPRAYLDRRLRDKGDASEVNWILNEKLSEMLKAKSPAETREWYLENRGYLHPGPDKKLTIDEDARELGVPIDQIEFFDKAIAALRSGSQGGKRARRLLAEYAPLDASNSTADQWEAWLRDNRDYLFFSDQGDYGWYIDPLAKKRGIPSRELRGPARASTR